MRGDVALAGDLTLDLDALAVRLVRVAAPFADEFAARRASAKLERALYERVASFTTAFAGGPAAGAAPAAPAAPPHTRWCSPRPRTSSPWSRTARTRRSSVCS
jgi:hypothetical protein